MCYVEPYGGGVGWIKMDLIRGFPSNYHLEVYLQIGHGYASLLMYDADYQRRIHTHHFLRALQTAAYPTCLLSHTSSSSLHALSVLSHPPDFLRALHALSHPPGLLHAHVLKEVVGWITRAACAQGVASQLLGSSGAKQAVDPPCVCKCVCVCV